MAKILVTGGAGFIGHHLVNALVQQGHECVVIDSGRSGRWSQVNPKAEKVNSDIEALTEEELAAALTGVEIVYHLAAEKYNSSSMTPNRVIAVNIKATDALFRACAKANVRRVVFTSSLYAYGAVGPKEMQETDLPHPSTHYGISKLAGEHLLAANLKGTNTTYNIARLFFIYGPAQFAEGGYKSVIIKNFDNILGKKPVTISGDGNQSLDYVYIDDCVEALILLGESKHSSHTVNVASGRAYSINEVAQKMCEVSGIQSSFKTIEPDWTANTTRVGNADEITRIFGWTSRTTLKAGLAKTFEWISRNEGLK